MSPYKFGRGRVRKWPKMLMFVSIAALLIAIAGVFGLKAIYENSLQPVNPSAEENITFVIENGDSVAEIAQGLSDKQIIRSSRAFTQYVRSHDYSESFQAGTYSLRQSYDVPTIVSMMVTGEVDVNLFTILPGARVDQIRQHFIDEGFKAADVDLALSSKQYAGHPALVDKPAGANLEGFLYPDSYQKIAKTTPDVIVKQSLDEMAEALTPDIRAGIAAQGLSVYQGIILASIIEREVGDRDHDGKVTDNRAKVAQVFLKRLKSGIKLQSNATDEVTEIIGPHFDTYEIEGLPPAPVSNVSSSALSAVANPAKTDFLYFVAGCDGITRFSGTNEQHEALIQQYGVAETESCNN